MGFQGIVDVFRDFYKYVPRFLFIFYDTYSIYL